VIWEDRELLAELARLNTAMASLALRIMDGSASVAEQHNYAQRLIAAGERLQQRAKETRERCSPTYHLLVQRIPQSLIGTRGTPRTHHLIRPRPREGTAWRPRPPRTAPPLQGNRS
jgi:hypothetical protein